MNLREFHDAELFYAKLAEEMDYGWVKVALAKALLKQEKEKEETKAAEDNTQERIAAMLAFEEFKLSFQEESLQKELELSADESLLNRIEFNIFSLPNIDNFSIGVMYIKNAYNIGYFRN